MITKHEILEAMGSGGDRIEPELIKTLTVFLSEDKGKVRERQRETIFKRSVSVEEIRK
jgi:hypothetical protein